MATFTIGGKDYELDFDDITNEEGMQIEKVCDRDTFTDWLLTVIGGQPTMTDMTCLVWLLQRREQPDLRFRDVRFTFGEYLQAIKGLAAKADDDTEPADAGSEPEGNPEAPSPT